MLDETGRARGAPGRAAPHVKSTLFWMLISQQPSKDLHALAEDLLAETAAAPAPQVSSGPAEQQCKISTLFCMLS